MAMRIHCTHAKWRIHHCHMVFRVYLCMFALLSVLFALMPDVHASDSRKIDREIIDEIKTKAIPRWKWNHDRLLELNADFEWVYEVETFAKHSGSSVPFDKFRNTYTGSVTKDYFITRSGKSIELNNPSYIASLQIGEQPNTFVLKDGKYKRAETELRINYKEAEFRALLSAAYPLEAPYGITSALKDETRLVSATRSGSQINLKWTAEPPQSRREITSYELTVTLNSAMDYRLERGSVTAKFERFKTTTEYTVETFEHDQLGTIPRQLKEVQTNSSDPIYKNTNTYTLTKISSPHKTSVSSFYLPYFDIPETALDAFDIRPTSGFGKWIVPSVCVTIAFIAFWISHKLARRKHQ